MVISSTLIGCAYITGEVVKLPVSQPVITNVSPFQASGLILANKDNARFVIVDVRTPSEYANGHIAEAINIDINSGVFREKAQHLAKDNTFLVYCRSGSRSAVASKILAELGFARIYNMTGSIREWQAAGLPLIIPFNR